MTRLLSSASTIENLRKEAKRWLKALHAADVSAQARLRAALSVVPSEPGLRDVQLALAREFGLSGWTALRNAVDALALERQTLAERAALVARSANWAADVTGALRVLQRWPEVGTFDLATAIAAGRVDEVRRRLAVDANAAARKTGPLDREPLLYMAYARLPGSERHATDVAALLLDQGADPNVYFNDGWDNRFTPLTGVIGQGEGVQPTHPEALALAELLIARGADPLDSQALYNTSICGDDVTWLDFLWERSVQQGRESAWLTVQRRAIGGQWNLSPLDYLLGNAVSFGHAERVEWLLAHGAKATTQHAYSGRPVREMALLAGATELAALLERHGAEATAPEGFIAFHIAAMNLDRSTAANIARDQPEVLQRHETLHRAASLNRTDVIELLLELGTSVDVVDDGESRAIHVAALAGALEAVKVLVAHGADVDRPTKHYGGAMGAAAFRKRRVIAEFLAPLSRDVNPITYFGLYHRLTELFQQEPALVNAAHIRTGNTPLFALPQDDEDAVRMAEFLLRHGASPDALNFRAQTAVEFLRERGLFDAADVVECARAVGDGVTSLSTASRPGANS